MAELCLLTRQDGKQHLQTVVLYLQLNEVIPGDMVVMMGGGAARCLQSRMLLVLRHLWLKAAVASTNICLVTAPGREHGPARLNLGGLYISGLGH
jgi:hypothetical protein